MTIKIIYFSVVDLFYKFFYIFEEYFNFSFT